MASHEARSGGSGRGTEAEVRRRLEELEAGERYARERYDLYKAQVYGPRPSSQGRLRELQQAWRLADVRLRLARSARPAEHNGNGSSP